MAELQVASHPKWNGEPLQIIGRLVGSMQKQCSTLICARGGRIEMFISVREY